MISEPPDYPHCRPLLMWTLQDHQRQLHASVPPPHRRSSGMHGPLHPASLESVYTLDVVVTDKLSRVFPP